MNRPNGFRRLLRMMAEGSRSPSRYIVRFRHAQAYRSFLALASKRAVSLRTLPTIHAVTCTLPAGADALLRLKDCWVEQDRKIASVHAVTLRSDAPVVPWGVNRIRAPKAWTRTTGRQIKIAVIDTGVDFSHPDLRRSVAGGINLVYRHMPPYDDNGHGTHIAGTIAAETEKNGLLGVAPGAAIYAVKAFDYNGTAYVSDIVSGIEWSVRNGIDIINMSFGMKTRSPSLEDAVRKAYRAGVIIIASSGNDARMGIDYPARYPEVISVGATNRRRAVATFSNKSEDTDIYAPGDRIVSTWPRNRYSELSGTSMATSHVSGVTALLLSIKPGLRTDEVRSLLQRSSVPIKSDAFPVGQSGEVDALRAVQLASGVLSLKSKRPSATEKSDAGKRKAAVKRRVAPRPR